MRQTLIRLRLDALWSLEPIDGVTAVGIGYLLIPWLLYGIWWVVQSQRSTSAQEGRSGQIAFWIVLGAVILTIPQWAPRPYVPVFGYGLMLFLGFMSAGAFATRRARLAGLGTDLVWDLAMWIFFAGIAGARLFYIFQYPGRVFANCKNPLDYLFALVNLPDGGLVLFGGVILASAAYCTFCYRRKLSPLAFGDMMVPSFFIGLAFGRMGCFLNGCCYGDRCTLPWAVTFPVDSVPFRALVERGFLAPDALGSLPLHPTQLYSVLNAAILAVLTATYYKYRSKDGAVVALSLMTYPITRILIELLRGDEMGQFGTGLTISQIVSLAIFAGGLLLWFYISRSSNGSAVVSNNLSPAKMRA